MLRNIDSFYSHAVRKFRLWIDVKYSVYDGMRDTI